MFMFKGNAFLDLVIFSANPGIIFVSMRMELCQSLQAFFVIAMVDEPTRRLFMCQCNNMSMFTAYYLWKEHDQQAKQDSRDNLQA